MRNKLLNETAGAAAAAVLGGLIWIYFGFALLYGALQQPLV